MAIVGTLSCSAISTGTTLATVQGPRTIFVDGERAFVSTDTDVFIFALDGGAQTTFISANGDSVALWAIDDDSVYGTRQSSSGLEASMFRAPKDGGAQSVLLDVAAAPLALDDSYVYWPAETPTLANATAIMRISKDGGIAVTVTPIVDLTGLGVAAIAVDSDYVYWTTSGASPNTNIVARVPKGGGPSMELTTTAASFTQIAVDENAVYWVGSSYGDASSCTPPCVEQPIFFVNRFDKQTSNNTALPGVPAIMRPFTQSLITASGYVFWFGNDALLATSDDGGATSTLAGFAATTYTGPISMATQNGPVYWISVDDFDSGAGSIHVTAGP